MLRRQPVHSGAFTEADVAAYKHALARPGALTAAINYYRAAFSRPADDRPCPVPTLVLWGEKDAYLGPRLTEGLERWAPNVRVDASQTPAIGSRMTRRNGSTSG